MNIIANRARELEQDGTWDEIHERVSLIEEQNAKNMSAMDAIEKALAKAEEREVAEITTNTADDDRESIGEDDSVYKTPLECDLLYQINSMEDELDDLACELHCSIEEAERDGISAEVIDGVLAEVDEQIHIARRNSEEAEAELGTADTRRKVREAKQDIELEEVLARRIREGAKALRQRKMRSRMRRHMRKNRFVPLIEHDTVHIEIVDDVLTDVDQRNQIASRDSTQPESEGEWWKEAKFEAIRQNTLAKRHCKQARQAEKVGAAEQLEVVEWWKEPHFEAFRLNTLEKRGQRECEDRLFSGLL